MVKVVFKFSNKVGNGFGDQLRGLITCLQIKKNLHFDLIVDMIDYNISDYLIYEKPDVQLYEHRDLRIFYYESENDYSSEIMEYINDNINNDYVIIYTNAYPRIDQIDDEITNYFRNLFTFNESFNEYFRQKISSLPENYVLFHYRLGDHILIYNNRINNMNDFIDNFKNNKKENTVLISDSLEFKQKIAEIFDDVTLFLNNPSHSGVSHADIDMYVDFFLIKNAKQIYAYSNYRWISNFIYWTSIIYNVPLVRI
jgi:hypothetical protein